MIFDNLLRPRDDLDVLDYIFNNESPRISGDAGDLIQFYNDEYYVSCCRFCGYYVCAHGCLKCGLKYEAHMNNVLMGL